MITGQRIGASKVVPDAAKNLAAAVIKNAVVAAKTVKWEKPNALRAIDLLSFFWGGWFEGLADHIDLDPDVVRRHLNLRAITQSVLADDERPAGAVGVLKSSGFVFSTLDDFIGVLKTDGLVARLVEPAGHVRRRSKTHYQSQSVFA